MNKPLKNVYKVWKLKISYRFSNTFWLYQYGVPNATFQWYNKLLLTIFKLNTRYYKMMMILYNNWPLMFFTWIITLLSHRNVKVAFRINISFFSYRGTEKYTNYLVTDWSNLGIFELFTFYNVLWYWESFFLLFWPTLV